MKLLITAFLSFLIVAPSFGQSAEVTDTTIYEVAETLPYPLLKGCLSKSNPEWNVDSVRRCGEMQLLSLLSSNMRYPAEAREQGIQGTVVLSFVVEPSNGRISNIGLLKDIGGGCGAEAIRVLTALDDLGLRWAPAMLKGTPVRLRHSIPLRYKLQEALPYFITEQGDSIYTNYDTEPAFKQGMDSLINYVFYELEYPEVWEDSCKTGVFEMALLIRSDGASSVENVLDFSNLGLDFQWEAMRLANRMQGMWAPATYMDKAVNATLPLRVVFKSDSDVCESSNDLFDKAMMLADEGSVLLGDGKAEEAIKKWTEALSLAPNNCEILYYRGTALLNINKRDEACKDFALVKSLLGTTWFEDIRRVICGY